MAGQDIKLTISAKDDASKVIKDVAKGLDKVGDAAEDAADAIVRELNAGLDATEARVKQVSKASDALASALGPELAGRVDTAQLVQEFEMLGASLDQVEAKAEEFAAAIRRADDINLGKVRSELSGVDASVRKVGDSTDRSRSVMANFAGNAAQDLPGVANSFGALNVAVGQFAEYATEGGIKLKGLLATFGPIAAGTVIVGLLAKNMQKAAETKAWETAQVKAWADAVQEGADAAATIAENLEKAGKVELLLMGGKSDVTDEFARLGLKVEQYLELVEGGPEKINAWVGAMIDAGAEAGLMANLWFGLNKAHEMYAEGLKVAAAQEAFFGTQAKRTQEELTKRTRATWEARDATTELADAADTAAQREAALAAAAEDAAGPIREVADQLWRQVEAGLALEDAQDGVEQALADLKAAYKKGDWDKADDEFRDAKRSIASMAQTAGDAAADGLGPMASEHAKATASANAQIESLDKVRQTLAVGSPLRQALDEWIAALQKIPGTVTTRLSVTGSNPVIPLEGAYHDGGVVPGRPGQEVPILAMAGETVLPTHKGGASAGGGLNIYVTVNAGIGANGPEIGREAAKAIAGSLQKYGYR